MGGSGSDFLSGGGEMAGLIGAVDWAQTSLGPIDDWPQSLKTTVSLCLASNFPINIIWGPDHLQIYNDGYKVVCGEAHPRALGEAYTVTWKSAWPAIGAPFEHARAGETSFLENQRMFLQRNGYLEETFFTFSLSPIRDESGGIGGLFHPVTETTTSMLAERRTRCLRDLNARLAEARTTAEVCVGFIEICAAHALDLPYLLIHAWDGEAYRLAGQTGADSGVAPGELLAPPPLPAGAHEPVELPQGAAHLAQGPCGPYDEPPSRAFALPVLLPGLEQPAAVVVAGVSPRLPLDDAYRSFFALIASAFTAGLANAKTYEDERRRAELLAALDQAKTTFFSNVSHEFRTPLTLMLGPIEDALGDPAPMAGPQRMRLEVAHRNALRLLKLVNSLLDFSRVEAGRMQASFQPTDLAAFTAELASNFRSACERAGLSLTVDCQPLRESVFIDRDLWEKVVLNLISNAFKFTLEGGIGVSLRQVGGGAELTVSDTGVGIPEAHLGRVFERFHRIEGQSGRTHEGTGIGLALVDELVRLHGGTIEAESREGAGTSFRAVIPFGSAHLPTEQVAAERGAAGDGAAQAFVAEALRWLPGSDETGEEGFDGPASASVFADHPRIVLADDNADMRSYVQRLLEAAGYQVTAVANGRAALEAIRAGSPPDLLLSDVMMPELDGFGLLAEVRADPGLDGLLTILLSARAGEEARIEGLAAGADDYLVKPFNARELRARVDGTIRLGRQRREAASRERELTAQIAAERARAALTQSEDHLNFALRAGQLGSWELDHQSGQLRVSDAFRVMFDVGDEGLDSLEQLTARLPPDDQAPLLAALDACAAGATDLDLEVRLARSLGEHRWVRLRGRGLYDAGGRLIRLGGICADVSHRKRGEQTQRMLLAELNHRVKNTLATVQSITVMTGRKDRAPEDYIEALQSRIGALALAHDLLSATAWDGASLTDVVARTLAPYVGDGAVSRVTFEGPGVRLGPNAAVSLNMAFHELATNAAKYGALSVEGGRVDIRWRPDQRAGAPVIAIDWRESGGPEVTPPTDRGFGSRLIQRGLTREFGGEVTLGFAPAGVVCEMRLPLSGKLAMA